MATTLHILPDLENSTTNVITGTSAEILHAQDVSSDQRRPERGDMEFVIDITAYTSGTITPTLVGADNAALTTNAVVFCTGRAFVAVGTSIMTVPQDLNNKDFIGILTVAEAHAATVTTRVQSTQMRQRGR